MAKIETITIHGKEFKVRSLPKDAPFGLKNVNAAVEVTRAMMSREIPLSFYAGSGIVITVKRFLEGNIQEAVFMNEKELGELEAEIKKRMFETQQLNEIARAHRMIRRELARMQEGGAE